MEWLKKNNHDSNRSWKLVKSVLEIFILFLQLFKYEIILQWKKLKIISHKHQIREHMKSCNERPQ